MFTECGDGIAGIKRRRRDLSSDGVRDLVTSSGRGRLKEDQESSTWRREGWNRIEEYVQYQDDMWDDLLPSMNVSSISKAMQPTFKGRLKGACNKISYLETPTRELGLDKPLLIWRLLWRIPSEAIKCDRNKTQLSWYTYPGRHRR
ncbi:hypothetical protein Tco_0115964 [Tanacetum coccineum]